MRQKHQLQRLTINLATTRHRREVFNGRSYLVVPAVTLVEGVLPGSNGALLYTANEMRRTYRLWDKVPLTLNHPQKDGSNVSVRAKGMWGSQGIGFVRNTRFDYLPDGRARWKAEAWFDEERTRKLASNVLDAILAGRVLELSTGLFTDNITKPGVWRGAAYNAVATNYKPDHLAILVDQIGACSVRDGCGCSLAINARTLTSNAFAHCNCHFTLTLNKWSDEARRAAIEARKRKGGTVSGQEQPKTTGERVKIGYAEASEYLKKKGIVAKDKAEVRSLMEKHAKERRHNHELRKLGEATKARKAQQAAAGKSGVQESTTSGTKATAQRKAGDQVQASKVTGSEPKPKPKQKVTVESKSIESKEEANPVKIRDPKPATPPTQKKSGRPKYQDSGKRVPLVAKKDIGRYAAEKKRKKKTKPKMVPLVAKKDIGRYAANAWSEAARRASAEKRRRKGIKREYKEKHGGDRGRGFDGLRYHFGKHGGGIGVGRANRTIQSIKTGIQRSVSEIRGLKDNPRDRFTSSGQDRLASALTLVRQEAGQLKLWRRIARERKAELKTQLGV